MLAGIVRLIPHSTSEIFFGSFLILSGHFQKSLQLSSEDVSKFIEEIFEMKCLNAKKIQQLKVSGTKITFAEI